MFTVHFGGDPAVVLHGYDAIKEALIERADEFAPRGRLPLIDKINKGRGRFCWMLVLMGGGFIGGGKSH